ncbi:MAG: HAD family hydrolase [Candidatus Omnitrophota bacterium]
MKRTRTIFDPKDFVSLKTGGDGRFTAGKDGILKIFTPLDRKVEFICYADKTFCYVKSALGYPALYPLEPAEFNPPLEAVLMDLDGTSIKSETFWVRVIEMVTSVLRDKPDFRLEEADLPHVSGHSVSEHLQYCINKYCPDKTVEEARKHYFDVVREQMGLISRGKGWKDAFVPAPGLKEFLLELKSRGFRIGLVTAGLHEKAWPAIVSAFRTLGLGDPASFYDAIITAGFIVRKGSPGTLGELVLKPHPWLYAETGRIGLGIPYKERKRVIGLEDSSAGVVSLRLAGYSVIGIGGGNIIKSGVKGLCSRYCETLTEALKELL